MKKIWLVGGLVVGLLLLLLASAQVASFSIPKLRLRGATLTSLSSDLLISNEVQPSLEDYRSYGELRGAQDLVPGSEGSSEFFWIRNNNEESDVSVLARFVPGNQDWEKLAPLIEVRLEPEQANPTDWTSLSQLTDNPTQILSFLAKNDYRRLVVRYRMVSEYAQDPDGDGPLLQGEVLGSEILNLTTSGVGLELSSQEITE